MILPLLIDERSSVVCLGENWFVIWGVLMVEVLKEHNSDVCKSHIENN